MCRLGFYLFLVITWLVIFSILVFTLLAMCTMRTVSIINKLSALLKARPNEISQHEWTELNWQYLDSLILHWLFVKFLSRSSTISFIYFVTWTGNICTFNLSISRYQFMHRDSVLGCEDDPVKSSTKSNQRRNWSKV